MLRVLEAHLNTCADDDEIMRDIRSLRVSEDLNRPEHSSYGQKLGFLAWMKFTQTKCKVMRTGQIERPVYDCHFAGDKLQESACDRYSTKPVH